jgi:chromosome partitioning protein
MHESDKGVALVDADPQCSAPAWCEQVQAPWLTTSMPIHTIHQRADQLARGGDLVIDTPPGDLGIITSSLRAATLTVIPLAPAMADLAQVAETTALIEDVAALNDMRSVVLLTRVVKRTIAATQNISTQELGTRALEEYLNRTE